MSSSRPASTVSTTWRSVPDWVVLAFAVLLFIVALISPSEGNSYLQTGWGIVLAIALGATSLWALAQARPIASIFEGGVGLIIFLMPWFGGAQAGWAWLSWCIGVLVLVTAFWSYYSMPTTQTPADLRQRKSS